MAVVPPQKTLVIMAEDQDYLGRMAESALQNTEYELHHHLSGVGALAELESLKVEIEKGRKVILLTDNSMPEMNGTELVTAVVAQGIKVPVIMATSEADAAKALGKNVDVTLIKPYNPAELIPAFAEAETKFKARMPAADQGGMTAKYVTKPSQPPKGHEHG